jgi:hypothetical protein
MLHFKSGYHVRDYLAQCLTITEPFTVFEGTQVFNSLDEYKAFLIDHYSIDLDTLPPTPISIN